MAGIKKGKVKRTVYRKETNHNTLKTLITNYLAAGKGALLFKDPHILAAFYLLGDAALLALATAISDYVNKTNGGSIETVEGKMELAVIWIDGYADQAEVIANDPANRTTQEEAIANLGLAGLPTQKITSTTKGKPAISELTGKRFSGGIIKATITNAHSNVYTSLTLIAVSVPPVSEPAVAPAVVTRTNDQLAVTCAVAVHMITKTIKGHPTEISLEGANPLLSYDLYVITQNGKKLVSDISLVITVHPV